MIILITGGSSGLGESITKTFAVSKENTVYFTYNNSIVNAQQIERDYSNTIGIKCDFSNEEDVKKLVEKIANLNPDVLINNAYTGTFINTHFHKTLANDFLQEYKQNIIPVILITQACINMFRKKRNGKIVTILTSALVNVPPLGTSVYVANKAYIKELSKIWAAENVAYNITSNTVSPSFMLTSFTKNIDERIVEQIEKKHPQKKLLTTNEVAETVLFLASASTQINGVDIVINAASNIK